MSGGGMMSTSARSDGEVAFPVLLKPEEHGRTMFLGVPLKMGQGGDLTPKKERFQNDVLTDFDVQLMRDIAIGLDLNQPVLIEGGADLGKTQAIDRVCAAVEREVYFVNCRDIEAEMLIGRMTAVEDAKSGFGWKDGIVTQAIRNGGVLVMDEYNKLPAIARASFHQIYDAILRDKGEIVLAENHGEVVKVHEDFRLVMTQNPPDGDYTNRDVIDPAELSRVVYLKYPAQLPVEIEKARLLGSFGLDPEVAFKEPESLPFQEPISKEGLATIPGIKEILIKFGEFHRHIRESIENRQLGADHAQPLHITFQRDVKRAFTFVSHYYDGDLTKTFQRAMEFYFVNRFESEIDREKVREAARLVEYTPVKGNTTRLEVPETDSTTVVPLASGTATAATATSKTEVETILGKNFIGPESIKKLLNVSDIGSVPPIPATVTRELLNKRCPLANDGRTIAETHRLIFVPNKLDGKDLTIASFGKTALAAKDIHGRGEILPNPTWFDDKDFAHKALPSGRWILMPDRELPNSRGRNYANQEKELAKFPEYHTAQAMEMVFGRGMDDLQNKPKRKSQPYYNIYMWCTDEAGSGRRVYVRIDGDGLNIGRVEVGFAHDGLGRAVLRNI